MDYTVIGLRDISSGEVLVAGVVEGRINIADVDAPQRGDYERVSEWVEADNARDAEQLAIKELSNE
jgi:hypothetical protein